MVVCRWSLVVGRWSLAVGPWSLVVGPWSLVVGPWSLVVGPWSLVLGPRSSVLGGWSSVLGRWSSVPRRQACDEAACRTKVDRQRLGPALRPLLDDDSRRVVQLVSREQGIVTAPGQKPKIDSNRSG